MVFVFFSFLKCNTTRKDSRGSGVGNNVRAAADGVVTNVSYQYNQKTGTGWGYYVEVTHSNGYVSRYAHLQKGGINVKVGDKVSNGNTIAKSGDSGGVTGPHLHFEILLNGFQIDPMQVLDLQKELDFINKVNEIEEVVITVDKKKKTTEDEPDCNTEDKKEVKPEEVKPEEVKPEEEKKDEKN
jgi:murein DD-endopeptidase MepM/ murein hydrolase activator NlpD